MVKKISIWTAFGQFFNLVESQYQITNENDDTDKDLIDLFPLSDYQNIMSSPIQVKNLQVLTCPTVLDDNADYVALPLKTVKSCPVALSFELPTTSAESLKLNELTPDMMAFFNIPSPIPTSFETRKLNEATDKMMSFWNVHVTLRKKNTAVEEEPKALEYEEEQEESVPSIFGKFEDLLEEETINEPLPTLFEKLRELLSSIETEDVSGATNFLETFANYFTEIDSNGAEPSQIEPIQHNFNCLCFNCWRSKRSVPKTWKNPSTSIPQLPVFVKSPVDSLKLYKCCPVPCSNVSTFTASNTGYEGDSESGSPTCSSCSCGVQTEDMETEKDLMRQKIQVQEEIIEKLTKLNTISSKLSQF